MSWESVLISLYLDICKSYREHLWSECQRFTNGGCKRFSDEEVITVYVYSVLRGFRTLKSIHQYARDHLIHFFPNLPGYAGFVHRVNKFPMVFQALMESLAPKPLDATNESVYLVDSFPIVLAQHNYAYTAKVATQLAGTSYCATKKMYYHGMKAHVVARQQEGTLPNIEILLIDEASRQDGPTFEHLRSVLHDGAVFGDQAYKRSDEQKVAIDQNLKVFTPCKKARGQKSLNTQQRLFSNAVSRVRQPIEALFAWIQKITGIQNASNVRSTSGFLSHIFGRFAAAMVRRNYPKFDF